MKELFKSHNFRPKTLVLIETINSILRQYLAMGFRLTVRQLYYQLVARGEIPNTLQSYKRIVSITGKAREAGLIDWYAIEDRARTLIFPGHWDHPAVVAQTAANAFRVDRWINQPNHVEVMIEKDAVAGVLEEICNDLDVRLWPNRGYSSLSMMYRHGQRIYDVACGSDKQIYILYCGDHDPSGLDMDRDIETRLRLFSYYTDFQFERLALTMPQIEEHDPPPQWAKVTDSRYGEYVYNYGEDVWELDALPPDTLRDVVRDRILELRDEDLFQELKEMDDAMVADLQHYADQYKERFDNGELEYIPEWYKELI